MGITPIQPVEGTAGEGDPKRRSVLDVLLVDELWHASEAASCGLDRAEFKEILTGVGMGQNFGLSEGVQATRPEQSSYFKGLKLNDLVLARACSAGKDQAWARFMGSYGEPLTRAAIAICGSEMVGRDLADQLYAELYGLTMRDGARRCPLDSYKGRGSLMGWLRTTLAQRHVDHYRRRHREEALGELDAPASEAETGQSSAQLTVLERAVGAALLSCDAEERLLLATYYLDGRRLIEIAQVLHVHEATVSRKLKRACEEIRKQVLKNLQNAGMSRGAAEEALGADPRDLDMNLKKLLQHSHGEAFKEKAEE